MWTFFEICCLTSALCCPFLPCFANSARGKMASGDLILASGRVETRLSAGTIWFCWPDLVACAAKFTHLAISSSFQSKASTKQYSRWLDASQTRSLDSIHRLRKCHFVDVQAAFQIVSSMSMQNLNQLIDFS